MLCFTLNYINKTLFFKFPIPKILKNLKLTNINIIMGAKEILFGAFYEALVKVNHENKLGLNPTVIEYIADILANYYRKVPLYLIDVKATTPFRLYKIRGDVSLLLVGFFNEWVNRLNRPLSENDYINSGKLNYEWAYLYLDMNFGRLLKEEMEKEYFTKYIKNKQELLYTQLDIFREISNLFEEYANLLKLLKQSNKNLQEFLAKFNELRLSELENLLDL